MIAEPAIHPVFDFKSVHMRMTFKPDGSRSFVGGYVPLSKSTSVGSYGISADTLAGMDVSGVYHACRQCGYRYRLDPSTGKRPASRKLSSCGSACFLIRVSTAMISLSIMQDARSARNTCVV